MGPTKPAAGVMATSPATAPKPHPAWWACLDDHSVPTQARVAAQVARDVVVARNAPTATPLAARALPALKPNQPNHKRAVPRRVRVRLWGGIGLRGRTPSSSR